MKPFSSYATLLVILLMAFALRVTALPTVPPGLFFDEASDGLDVWRVAHGEQFPIFFERDGGDEPLFNYLQALTFLLFDARIFSLRIVAAFVGVLTIPVVYQLVRQLAPDKQWREFGALIAASVVATLFWHVNFSRLAQRAILLPLFLSLFAYWLWRARSTARYRHWMIAGFCLGLCAYTYLAARLIPLFLLIFLALEFIQRRGGTWQDWLKPRLLFVLTALLIVAPLLVYFVRVPGAFNARVQDVTIVGNFPAIAENGLRVAAMFFIRGDLEWRHNLSGRPALDILTVVPFLVGFIAASWHWKKLQSQFLLVWLGVMLLPSILSAPAPDFARAIGAIPAVAFAVGWGWVTILSGLTHIAPRAEYRVQAFAIALVIVGSGGLTTYDYFGRWANDPRTFKDFEGGINEIGRWLAATEHDVYVPLDLYAHPTIQFLTRARFRQISGWEDAARQADAPTQGVALVVDSPLPRPFVLLRQNETHTAFLAPPSKPDLKTTEFIKGRNGNLAGLAHVPDEFENFRGEKSPLAAHFENGIDLMGWKARRELDPSADALEVTLYWLKRQNPPNEPVAFLHLLDAHGQVVAAKDALLTNGISIFDWKPKQTLPDQFLVPTPKPEPGQYQLEVGLYDPGTGERWNLLNQGASQDHLWLGPFKIPFDNSLPNSIQEVSARWNEGISLRGYIVDPDSWHAGDSSEWTLYWETTQPPTRDYALFVHLLDAHGTIVAQADHDPAGGSYPTSLWDKGESIPDPFTLTLPAQLAPGLYRLQIGWYQRGTQQRLALQMPADFDNVLTLATITVQP